MTKTWKKVLSLVLAMMVVFSIPVVASAADSYFDFTNFECIATDGDFSSRQVNKIKITLTGAAKKVVSSDVILTMGTNADADNMYEFKASDLKISFSGDKTVIEFSINEQLDHGTEYNFYIKGGCFASSDGKVNAGYMINTTGNLILSAIDNGEYFNNPLGRLIQKMESSKYAWLLYPIIVMVRFFMSL